MRLNAGRIVFGAATLAFGLVTFVRHDYRDWDQLRPLLNAADGPAFLYTIAAAQIAGGEALLFTRTAPAGALLAGVVYGILAVLCLPRIAAAPLLYDRWGNFFEQLSLVTGAALVFASSSSSRAPHSVARAGRIVLALCALSFAAEQYVHLADTAGLVPAWIPPSRVFWALATTVAFVLAAVAVVTNVLSLVAARLLTVMLLIFGALVWVPLIAAKPHSHTNWSEGVETFAIAGAVWVLAGLLGGARSARRRAR